MAGVAGGRARLGAAREHGGDQPVWCRAFGRYAAVVEHLDAGKWRDCGRVSEAHGTIIGSSIQVPGSTSRTPVEDSNVYGSRHYI